MTKLKKISFWFKTFAQSSTWSRLQGKKPRIYIACFPKASSSPPPAPNVHLQFQLSVPLYHCIRVGQNCHRFLSPLILNCVFSGRSLPQYPNTLWRPYELLHSPGLLCPRKDPQSGISLSESCPDWTPDWLQLTVTSL